MSADPRKQLLHELPERLWRLGCLALATKDHVLQVAHECVSQEELQTYLSGPLTWVEQYIAPIDDPAFLELCSRLASVVEPTELLRALALPEKLGTAPRYTSRPGKWWRVGAKWKKAQAPECLYCLANDFALLFVQGDVDRAKAAILLADALHSIGCSQHAAELLEKCAGLTHFIQGDVDRANAARLLANALNQIGSRQHAAELLEKCAGLTSLSYAERSNLERQLEECLGQLDSNTALSYIRTLADALRFTGRLQHATAALEAFAALSPALYADTITLAGHLKQRLSRRPAFNNNVFSYVQTLADALRFTARPQDAAAVLEGFVGLNQSLYGNPRALALHLDEQFGQGLDANSVATYIRTLADCLRFTNRHRDAVALLEAFAELSPVVYADRSALACQLDEQLGERLSGNTLALCLRTLAEALRFNGRYEHATALLDLIQAKFPGFRANIL